MHVALSHRQLILCTLYKVAVYVVPVPYDIQYDKICYIYEHIYSPLRETRQRNTDIYREIQYYQTHSHLNYEQIQTAALLQECLLIRDGLVHLPDVFTVSDMHVFIRYLCTC